ncbi:glycosyltransferase family 1 protein [Phlegmacium glaucopus]|nr:glycosyltransferase family 1 protein [Phlegmacium glaucopus]
MSTITAMIFIVLLAIWRLYTILPSKKPQSQRSSAHVCTIAVFLGSGGHTSEALALVSALDFRRYNRRIYIVSQGDNLSRQKAITLERSKEPSPQEKSYSILKIPRARRVGQTLLTTPFSAFLSLRACIYHLSFLPLAKDQRFADVLILNGPGTCFVLCFTIYLNKFFGLQAPLVIYVESFARVKSLSLSGKLIRPLADRFILQWPEPRDHAQRRNRNTWLV